MASGDIFRIQDTSFILGTNAATSGSRTVTVDMDLASLASGAARESDSFDLSISGDGVTLPEFLMVQLKVHLGTAPTVGKSVDAYVETSDIDGQFGGGLSGSDGVFASGDVLDQLATLAPAVSHTAWDETNGVQFSRRVRIDTPGRYMAGAVYNGLNQALQATTNQSRLIVTAYYPRVTS